MKKAGKNIIFNKNMKLLVRLSHKIEPHRSDIVISIDSKICSELSMGKVKCEV